MELGQAARGIIHTFRHFRGSEVVQNKHGHITVERSTKGGITFFFEIDYNTNSLLFTASITSDTKRFDKKHGRKSCIKQAHTDSAKTFRLPYDESLDLLDQIFAALQQAEKTSEIQDKPYLRTLLGKMRLYDQQNAEAALFYQDMIDTGAIVIIE